MELRRWQSDCIASAMLKYQSGFRHFLCLATPGAGKTVMAATLAQKLLKTEMVDLVLCFSPSVIISNDFQEVLEIHTQFRMDGLLGSKGRSLTYQSMIHQDESFWALFDTFRIFVIFDEIHHCAGSQLENANAWGQKLIRHIQGRATYTLALTGTPWRSDKIPIALSGYCQNNKIHCDFIYGLFQAIADKVCQTPQITLIDNNRVLFSRGDETERYSSFEQLLKQTGCSYQLLLENEDLIVFLLKQSAKKLVQLRKRNPNAGGLIVAASVEHAHKIASLLTRHLGETACIATYMEHDAHGVISAFKSSSSPWIISVGMISEGTDIPRLRVCCHLTRVKTELHFRQVLGRILRVINDEQGNSFLYMPAEPSLVEYANRIAEEIPASAIIRRENMKDVDDNQFESISVSKQPLQLEAGQIKFENLLIKPNFPQWDGFPSETNSILAQSYDASLNISGKFRQELLRLHCITSS
jgi:superfamily II DNA or RNA helicase